MPPKNPLKRPRSVSKWPTKGPKRRKLKNKLKKYPKRAEKKSDRGNPSQNLTHSQFLKLRAEWYSRLKRSGFKDIEGFNRRDGQANELLNGPNQSRLRADEGQGALKLHYYRRVSTWLACANPDLSPRDRLVLELYSDATSYRDILQALRSARLKPRLNLFSLHHLLKRYVAVLTVWNRVHPEGLDFSPDIEIEKGPLDGGP